MNVYHVNVESDGNVDHCPRRYVATLKEARAIKNRYNRMAFDVINNPYLKSRDYVVTIEKVKLDTSKSSILAMLNYEGGFEISSEEVA